MGLDRITAVWNRIRDSLWFVPAALALAAVALAIGSIQIDASGVLSTSPVGIWLFSGTASGARGVLTSIASGFITVTGVVFSVTIVALQLASTQFTPRILRNFTADRVNQVVLGVFIATFTYALLVLRVVRGESGGSIPADIDGVAQAARGPDAFVPQLSVTVALVLALVGIGFLIYFIDHIARSVQASVIIDRVTGDALSTVERRFQERIGRASEEPARAVIPSREGTVVRSARSGYVQGVDEDALMRLLDRDAATIRMEPAVGDFVLPGSPLATVWPAEVVSEGLEGTVREALILGYERTPHLDLELGVIELSDIAVKALSPGINDPTTAILCVDRIVEVLLAAGCHEPPGRVRRADGSGGTLVLPLTTFQALVDTALDEIRHYGVENPRFALTLIQRLGELGALLPDYRRPPVARHVAALLRTAGQVIRDPADRRRVEAAGARSLHALGVGGAP
ncbi:MAG: DUF2254 domain-containing protein [Gemmatimonadota bacterium]